MGNDSAIIRHSSANFLPILFFFSTLFRGFLYNPLLFSGAWAFLCYAIPLFFCNLYVTAEMEETKGQAVDKVAERIMSHKSVQHLSVTDDINMFGQRT